MKKNRCNKCYHSSVTWWVNQLLPFDFNIEQIPDAEMVLVDYFFRQPNKKSKVTNKYD